MSILEKSYHDNFTMTPNHIINNEEISLKAKGLYTFMASKPDGWVFSLNGLESQLKESRKSILNIMDELMQGRYLDKIKKRENGRQAANAYVLHAEPEAVTKVKSQTTEVPCNSNSDTNNKEEKPKEIHENEKPENESVIPIASDIGAKKNKEVKQEDEVLPKEDGLEEQEIDSTVDGIVTFIDMKKFLISNKKNIETGKHRQFRFLGAYVSISDKSIPYFRSGTQRSLTFEESDKFYKAMLLDKNHVLSVIKKNE